MRLVIETADNGRMRIWSDDGDDRELGGPAAADRPPTPAEADRDRRLTALGLSDFELPDEFKGNPLAERAWRVGLIQCARSYRRAALETNLIRPDPVASPAPERLNERVDAIDRHQLKQKHLIEAQRTDHDGLAKKVETLAGEVSAAAGRAETAVSIARGKVIEAVGKQAARHHASLHGE